MASGIKPAARVALGDFNQVLQRHDADPAEVKLQFLSLASINCLSRLASCGAPSDAITMELDRIIDLAEALRDQRDMP